MYPAAAGGGASDKNHAFCPRRAEPGRMPGFSAYTSGVPLNEYVIPFERLGMGDLDRVGGKNASLGEMIGSLAKLGVHVPTGFATTAQAFREFLEQDGLGARIRAELAALDVDDVSRLAAAGARIRQWMLSTPFPPALQQAIRDELR